MGELERLVVRHRHVAPMLSALLAGTDATVILRDPDGTVVLHREGGNGGPVTHGPFPITADGRTLGTIEGGPLARPIGIVLSYAVARELDKRALAREALDRYRELNLIYDLAGSLGTILEVGAIAAAAVAEAGRLPAGGRGFILLLDEASGRLSPPAGIGDAPFVEAELGAGILGRVAAGGEAELVNTPAVRDDATPAERAVPALLVAPMRAHERTIGILGTVATAAIEYRAGDLKVITAIAALAAPSLDHAMVHEAAVRELEVLRAPADGRARDAPAG